MNKRVAVKMLISAACAYQFHVLSRLLVFYTSCLHSFILDLPSCWLKLILLQELYSLLLLDQCLLLLSSGSDGWSMIPKKTETNLDGLFGWALLPLLLVLLANFLLSIPLVKWTLLLPRLTTLPNLQLISKTLTPKLSLDHLKKELSCPASCKPFATLLGPTISGQLPRDSNPNTKNEHK